MSVVYPSLPAPARQAEKVIEDIVKLLERRKSLYISRKVFLRDYANLRRELNRTAGYQELRGKVVARCNGMCEKCGKKNGRQLAHKKSVSHFPKLALREDNVYLACVECHQKDHPSIPVT